MAKSEFIVEGLSEIRRDLRSLDRRLPAKIAKGFRQTLNRHTLPQARSNLAAAPIPNVKGSVVVFAGQREAGISLRYSKYPWIAGGEYGSHRYRQFLPWVGNRYTGASNFPGYIVGKALRDTIAEIERTALDAVAELIEKEG